MIASNLPKRTEHKETLKAKGHAVPNYYCRLFLPVKIYDGNIHESGNQFEVRVPQAPGDLGLEVRIVLGAWSGQVPIFANIYKL